MCGSVACLSSVTAGCVLLAGRRLRGGEGGARRGDAVLHHRVLRASCIAMSGAGSPPPPDAAGLFGSGLLCGSVACLSSLTAGRLAVAGAQVGGKGGARRGDVVHHHVRVLRASCIAMPGAGSPPPPDAAGLFGSGMLCGKVDRSFRCVIRCVVAAVCRVKGGDRTSELAQRAEWACAESVRENRAAFPCVATAAPRLQQKGCAKPVVGRTLCALRAECVARWRRKT